jgi:tetratricopeptide (TPR) repeat protein
MAYPFYRKLTAPGLLLLLFSAPMQARADDHPQVEAAKRHNTAAKQHFLGGRYEEAAAEYQKAYDAKPMPIFLYNIGQCYRRVGTLERLKRALVFFERHQREAPDSPNKQVVDTEIEEVKREIAAKERATRVQQTFPTEVKPRQESRDESGDGERNREMSTSERPLYKRWWLWTSVGAVATLGAAVGLGLAARSDYDKAEELGTQPTKREEWERTTDSGKAKSLGANILFGVAGGLAVTSVVLFFLDKPEPRGDSTVQLAPAFGDNSAGITLQGSF